MQKVIAFAVFSTFLVTGCGEGDQAASSSQPQVEYASPETASVDIQNYMNADWLYDEYFGEYGFPDEFRVDIIEDIKLVANGFALQFARGDGVEQNIADFRSGILLLQTSGQFSSMISYMSETWHSGEYEAMKPKPSEADVEPVPGAVRYGHDKSPEEIARLKALGSSIAKDNAALLKAQEELVEKYNLPYELPGRAPKYIIFSQSMKNGGKKGGSNNNQSPTYKHQSFIDTWLWYPGDIVWSDGGAGFGHMGIVTHFNTTESSERWLPSSWRRPAGARLSLVDANLDGVKERWGSTNLRIWQNRYDTVRRYTYNHMLGWDIWTNDYNTSLPNRMFAIANWAKNQVGKPYNWNFFNKDADDSAYCSQLVWNAYKQTGQPWLSRSEWRDIDLDSNGGLVVFPNDILNHSKIKNERESKKVQVAACRFFCF